MPLRLLPPGGRAKCPATFLIVFGLTLLHGFFHPSAALAQQCATASNTTNNCSGTLVSGGGTTIGTVIPAVGLGQDTNNTTTNIANGSVLTGDNRTTTSIGNTNILNIGSGTGGASLTTTTTTGTNSGIGSMYTNGGPNTVEIGANNTVNISQGSSITATGNNARSEAINVFGFGNTIINHGTIFSNTSSAIFLQNNPDAITSTSPAIPGGGNTNLTVPEVPGFFGTVMRNFGTITDVPNPGAAPGTSGIAFAETPQNDPTAATANRNVYFANEPGATVNGNIVLGNGNDTVELFSGSTVNGDVDGGPNPYFIGGVRNKDTLILNSATGSGELNGTLKDFDILTKTGSFSWEITGPLSSTRFLAVEDVQGTLILSGNTPAPFDGSMTIDPAGTLQIGNGGTTGSFAHDILNNGFVAFDRSDTLAYSNVISGSGGVNQIGTGTTIFDTAQTYTGPTTVTAGTLAAGGVDVFSAASHTVVQSGGTLALEGFDQTLNNGLENAGTVELGIPGVTAPGTTLTVAGNYVGNDGTIGLNTFLGTDGSPSDRLVINGGVASGSTFLRITNVGGPGALTRGNGILVIDASNGGTEAGSFALAGEVRAGAIDYDLFRGAADGSDFQSWFLRSDFTVPPPGNGGGGNGFGNGNGGGGNGGVEELPGGGIEFPTDPPPTVLPPGTYPIIGPELATYGVVQPIARQMGLTTLGTLHERVGDAAADATCLNTDLNGNSAALDSAAITKAPPVPYVNCRQPVWGRLFGQQIDNHYQAFADPRASGQVAGIQTGIDLWRGSFVPGHSDAAGVYFAYGNGNVSVDGLVTNSAVTAYILEHTGSLNLNAYSFGGYWTHYGPTGWYIDAVLQGSFYQGNASTQFANLPTNGTGFISSLEAGYPIPLPWLGPGFVLEPESQIVWQQVSFDGANDGLGPVALGTTSGASGRLGLRGKWTINDPAGRVWQPYVLANVWHDWGAEATTTFGIDQVPLIERATRLEFAGGLSAKILPGLTLYAQAGYQLAVSGSTDGGRRDGVNGDFGVHYAW